MNQNLLEGQLVHLAAAEPKELAEAFQRWSQDTEYWRLLASDANNRYSLKKYIEWIEKEMAINPPESYQFAIRTIENDQLVGFAVLNGDVFPQGEAFVGIGLGEREFWGKGYGTDAMRVVLRYAFQELNLRRVALCTFEYNPRAVHSYEKAGFTYEGRARGYLCREGKRWDLLYMGILREEWQAGDG